MSIGTAEQGKGQLTIKDVAHGLMPSWSSSDWFSWPPDIFALTSIILRSNASYWTTVSTSKTGQRLGPTAHESDDQLILEWSKWIRGEQEDLPVEISRMKETLFSEKSIIDADGGDLRDDLSELILRLHGLADSACSGFGTANMPKGPAAVLYFVANITLDVRGTLSRLPKRHGVVLPKTRTPQTGLSLRSFSLYLTFHRTEVSVRWRSLPWSDLDDNTMNILAIPFPFEIQSESFRACDYPKHELDVRGNRYFEYVSDKGLDVDIVIRLLRRAHKDVNRVHIIVLPELALTSNDLRQLKGALIGEMKAGRIKPTQIPMIITGLRSGPGNKKPVGSTSQDAKEIDHKPERRRNRVNLSFYFVGKWYDLYQEKHHRWRLDASQIRQYSLAGNLHVENHWWEGIDLGRRSLTFVNPNSWLTLCPLICEDLAQLEPVSDLIRGLGPTMVIALLMDGPQIEQRWAGRYVGVLADDPGTSILSLTSLGMAIRSKPKGKPESKVVALWKDQEMGAEELSVGSANEGLLLTINAKWKEEFTADCRRDDGSAVLTLQGVRLIQPASNGELIARDEGDFGRNYADIEELSKLTYFVDAVIDAPKEIIFELQQLLLLEEEHIQSSTLQKIRPLADLYAQIRASFLEWFLKDSGESWPRSDFKKAIGQLICFVQELKTEGEQEFEWWGRLFVEAKKALDSVQRSDSERTNAVIYRSVMWAIHNRFRLKARLLTRARRREGHISDGVELVRYRQWLAKIDACLIDECDF